MKIYFTSTKGKYKSKWAAWFATVESVDYSNTPAACMQCRHRTASLATRSPVVTSGELICHGISIRPTYASRVSHHHLPSAKSRRIHLYNLRASIGQRQHLATCKLSELRCLSASYNTVIYHWRKPHDHCMRTHTEGSRKCLRKVQKHHSPNSPK
jgi:hypothetical protein